ncbi:hypothetical protein [Haloferula helveola]
MPTIKTLRHLLPITFVAGNAMATAIVDVDFAHLAPLVGDPDGLDDGDRIEEVSGNGYHGFWGATNSNVPVVTAGSGTGIDTSGDRVGKVFLRDGLGGIPEEWDGPTTSVSPYFSFDGTQSYTFEAVVNWNFTAQAVNGLMGQVGGNEIWIRESGGFLNYAFVSGGANANLFTSTIDISAAKADGEWHVVSVVYDATAGEIRSYLDGVLKHTNTDADIGTLGTMVSATGDFYLGAYNGTSSSYFDGLQDRYRISTGALDPVNFLTAPAVAGGNAITWTGGTDGNWDATTAGNWKLDADDSPILFTDGDDVTFDEDGATGLISITGTVQPDGITVSASSVDYTLSGGTLGGTGTLLKSGTSTLTFAGPVSRTGSTQIDGGILVIGDGATVGDAPAGVTTIATGASLVVSRSDTVDYSGSAQLKQIDGDGSVTIDGGGTVIVNPGTGIGFDEASSWSALSGGVTVIGGSELQTLRNGRTAMGSGPVTLGDGSSSGALSQYNGSWTWTNDIVLVGTDNAIRNRSSAAFARQLKLQGVISGSGGLTFEDPNSSMTDNQLGYILTGENTADGTITIDSGVPVRVGGVPGDTNVTQNGPDAAGSLGTAAIVNNGSLTFSRTDSHTVANTITGDGELFVGLDSDTPDQVVDLTGSATNTGDTTVRAGTLLINGLHGSQSPGPLSLLEVLPGATVGGGGQTASDINLEGTLAPGNSTGTFTTTNWIYLFGNSTYAWELTQWSGGIPGTDSDLLVADEIQIDLTATPLAPVTIAILPDSIGDFTESAMTFVIAQSGNGITGFDSDLFEIDDSAFATATGATGTWTIQQNGNDLELVYAPGAGLTGFALWIDGFYPGESDPLIIGTDADPDKDGIGNALEMLLGGNPTAPNDVALPDVSTTAGDLVLEFTRDDQAIGVLDVIVETSTDLSTWPVEDQITVGETSGPGVTVVDNGSTDLVTVTIPKAGASAKFARLRLVVP